MSKVTQLELPSTALGSGDAFTAEVLCAVNRLALSLEVNRLFRKATTYLFYSFDQKAYGRRAIATPSAQGN